jgi:hypothetical protein
LIVGRLLLERIANLNVLGDGVNALDPLHRGDGGNLLRVIVDVSAQAGDVLVDGNPNVLTVKARRRS